MSEPEKETKSVAPPSAPGIVDWCSWGCFPFMKAKGAATTTWDWLWKPASIVSAPCLVVGLLLGAAALWCYDNLRTPKISLPATLSAPLSRSVEIDATTNGKTVSWEATAPDYDLVIAAAPSAKAAFVFPKSGQYVVTARTAIGSKIATATCAVTVGDAPPDPPGPGPNPPPPADLFTQGLQAAYTADGGIAKAQQVQFLAAIYQSFSTSVVTDASLKTLLDLFNKLHATVSAPTVGLAATDLQGVRAYLAQDMNAVIGTTANTPLTDALRKTVAQEFAKVSKALQEIK